MPSLSSRRPPADPARRRLSPFALRAGELRSGPHALAPLARRFGTPLYVYDWESIAAAYQEFDTAFAGQAHLICTSVKANGNVALLLRLAALGSGFDIVSEGELRRVLAAGGDPAKVVFSGVGKTAAEMDAALDADILLFNVESQPELELLAERARRKRRRARFGIRVNPDIEAPTHPHIATGLHRHKFGVELRQAAALYRAARKQRWLEAAGISFHIGSQILDPVPFASAVERVIRLVTRLRAAGLPLRYFDIGGGVGIPYGAEQAAPSLAPYAAGVQRALAGFEGCLLMEPGRRIFGPAGALLTRVQYVKRNAGRIFVITDAGYNDLIRLVLYSAHHEIVPLRPRRGHIVADVVGPICETADAFARERRLPRLQAGDLLAILDAGAYGYSLSSNYNARRRPAEVLLTSRGATLIRRRETWDDLLATEAGGE